MRARRQVEIQIAAQPQRTGQIPSRRDVERTAPGFVAGADGRLKGVCVKRSAIADRAIAPNIVCHAFSEGGAIRRSHHGIDGSLFCVETSNERGCWEM